MTISGRQDTPEFSELLWQQALVLCSCLCNAHVPRVHHAHPRAMKTMEASRLGLQSMPGRTLNHPVQLATATPPWHLTAHCPGPPGPTLRSDCNSHRTPVRLPECRADGISNVFYTQGQCSVQSAFLLTSPCQQSGSISVAQSVPTPTWTQARCRHQHQLVFPSCTPACPWSPSTAAPRIATSGIVKHLMPAHLPQAGAPRQRGLLVSKAYAQL